MLLRNTKTRFGSTAKLLHWTLAILVIAQLYFVYWKTFILPAKSPIANFYINGLHKPIGVLIMPLALIVIHTAAALKHHYFDKDNVLKRMLWD